jgi:DNA replication protein DnaC
LFSSATALIAMLGKALAEGRLEERLKLLSQPQLLIIDEIGYLPIAARAPTCSSNRSSAAMNAVRYHHQQSESRRLG